MKQKICQSCGMPMEGKEDLYGLNADGSLSEDYCKHCFENGMFTTECTMEEMIDFCAKHIAEQNLGTEEELRGKMLKVYPTFKRWSKL